MKTDVNTEALEKAQEQLDELAGAVARCPNDTDGDKCGFFISRCDICKGTGTVAMHEWARRMCDRYYGPGQRFVFCSQHGDVESGCPGYRPRKPDEVRLEDLLVAEKMDIEYHSLELGGKWFASIDLTDYMEFGDTPTLAAISAAHAAWKERQS